MLSSDELLTRAEVASLLKVSLQTVKHWHRDGILVGHRMGKRLLRYHRADVVAFALNRADDKSAS